MIVEEIGKVLNYVNIYISTFKFAAKYSVFEADEFTV